MKSQVLLAAAMAVATVSGFVQAEEKKADPTGTWKWTVMMQDQSREVTLKLKLEDNKLTGAIVGRNNQETKIEDATFKDGEVAFAVIRERNGQKITSKYKGKLDGDTIKGQIEFERNGESRKRDWEAKRETK